jgi:hypothetical protein
MSRIMSAVYSVAFAISLLCFSTLVGMHANADSGSATCKRGSCQIVCQGSMVQSHCTANLPRCNCSSSGVKSGSISFQCEMSSCSKTCDKGRPEGGCFGPHLKTYAKCVCK